MCSLQVQTIEVQAHTLHFASAALTSSLDGWTTGSTAAALGAGARCSFGTASLAGPVNAELEGVSRALVGFSLPAPLPGGSLDGPICAASCGCLAWLAVGKGPGASAAVLLLLNVLDACFSRAPVSCDFFARTCCSTALDALGSSVSSTLCTGQHN